MASMCNWCTVWSVCFQDSVGGNGGKTGENILGYKHGISFSVVDESIWPKYRISGNLNRVATI